jgi:hypothetical protein
VLPTLFEIEGNGRVVSESWESAFGSVINRLVFQTGLPQLVELLEGKGGRRINDIEM